MQKIKEFRTKDFAEAFDNYYTKFKYQNQYFKIINIGNWILNSNDTLEIIVSSRNENRYRFFAQEIVTIRSTKEYLESDILAKDNRILSFIVSNSKQFVGQLGIKNLKNNEGEIDAVLKYNFDCPPMNLALSNYLKTCNVKMNINRFYLHVRADNLSAIALYSRVGFRLRKSFGEKTMMELVL